MLGRLWGHPPTGRPDQGIHFHEWHHGLAHDRDRVTFTFGLDDLGMLGKAWMDVDLEQLHSFSHKGLLGSKEMTFHDATILNDGDGLNVNDPTFAQVANSKTKDPFPSRFHAVAVVNLFVIS